MSDLFILLQIVHRFDQFDDIFFFYTVIIFA